MYKMMVNMGTKYTLNSQYSWNRRLDAIISKSEALTSQINSDIIAGVTTEEEARNKIKYYLSAYWVVPLDTPDNKVASLLKDRYFMVRTGGTKQNTTDLNQNIGGEDGEGQRLENLVQTMNVNRLPARIERDYKVYLLLLESIISKSGLKTSVSNSVTGNWKIPVDGIASTALLYEWIGLAQNNLIPDFRTDVSKSKRNDLISAYTTNNQEKKEVIQNLIEQFCRVEMKKGDYYSTRDTIMLDLYILLTEILGIEIFSKENRLYTYNDVLNVIKNLSKIIPDSKFDKELINKSTTVQSWFESSRDDIINEYQFEEFKSYSKDISLPAPEIVSGDKSFKLPSRENEIKNLVYLQHLRDISTGEVKSIINRVHSKRLAILEGSNETYKVFNNIINDYRNDSLKGVWVLRGDINNDSSNFDIADATAKLKTEMVMKNKEYVVDSNTREGLMMVIKSIAYDMAGEYIDAYITKGIGGFTFLEDFNRLDKLANSLFPQEHLYKTSLGFKTIHDYALKIKIKYTRSTFIGENNDYNEGVKWEEGEFLVTNDYYLYRYTSEGRSSEKLFAKPRIVYRYENPDTKQHYYTNEKDESKVPNGIFFDLREFIIL